MKTVLYDKLYTYLLDEIKSGRLKNGERVPSEKELAAQFNVSRVTSKKALDNLRKVRVVIRSRGKGTFVAKELPDLDHLPVLNNFPISASDENQFLIGLILEDFSSSYGLKLLQAIEERCSENNCQLLLKRSYGSRDEEEKAIKAFLKAEVDGLIVFPVHGDYYNNSLLRLIMDEFPVVFIDRYLKGIAAYTVYIDNLNASFELTNYLIEQGHREIAFLSSPAENTSTIEDRIQGYTNALIERGLKPSPQNCLTTLHSTLSAMSYVEKIQGDSEAIRNFVEQNPQITAFIACEYNIALTLNRVLNSIDRLTPKDYKVVCFDSVESFFDKPLFTHIQQDEITMGYKAVDAILAQLGEQPFPLQTVVGYNLIKAEAIIEQHLKM